MENFSIILPVYNRAKIVINSINSVIHQNYNSWELIIINDGSTDNIEDLINEIGKNEERIRLISIPNNGASYARNIGIQNSNYNWICFLDSDDWWHNEYLFNLNQYIQNNNKFQAFYSSIIINDKIVEAKDIENISDRLLKKNVLTGLPAFSCKKEYLLEIKGFDENLPSRQDVDLYYRLSKLCNFKAIPLPLVHVSHDLNDRISTNYKKKYSGVWYFIKKYKVDLLRNPEAFIYLIFKYFKFLTKSIVKKK
jgi:glycosyltransferase involved in cell wall biosynthesis